jgi:hypothetical protein
VFCVNTRKNYSRLPREFSGPSATRTSIILKVRNEVIRETNNFGNNGKITHMDIYYAWKITDGLSE